jgi:hypothetical protein
MSAPGVPAISASLELTWKLLAGERAGVEDAISGSITCRPMPSFELTPTKRLQLHLEYRQEDAFTQNIIGLIEGAGPVLKREYVVVGAHYDHVGVTEPIEGRGIMNGADDNGSGTVGLLAIAKALATGPKPKRSMLLVWFAGEEHGEIGSRDFVASSPVPLANIAAYVNLDMIGRRDRGVLDQAANSTELYALADAVNQNYLRLPLRDFGLDDLSDAVPFGVRNVPYLTYMEHHADAHSVRDTVDRIDYAFLEAVARTAYDILVDRRRFTCRGQEAAIAPTCGSCVGCWKALRENECSSTPTRPADLLPAVAPSPLRRASLARNRLFRSWSLLIPMVSSDGKLLWVLKGMSTIQIPTPLAAHGLLYISSGYPGDPLRPIYAIRPGASGDISLKPGETSKASIVWSQPTAGAYNPSGLVHGDYYYTSIDRGMLTCNDAKTGKEIYPRQRITADGASFTASPWTYNGRIFAMSEEGDTYVLHAGPEFKVLGKNSLNEMTLATPAVANGSLIVRTASKLYRVGRKP